MHYLSNIYHWRISKPANIISLGDNIHCSFCKHPHALWCLTLFSSWMIWNLTFSSLSVTESNNTRYKDFPGCRSFWRLSRQEIIFGLPSSCSSYHTEGHNTVRNVYLIILNWIFSNTIISTSSQEEKEGIYFWAHQNAYEWDVRGVQGFIHHHSRWFFITIIVLIQVSSS